MQSLRSVIQRLFGQQRTSRAAAIRANTGAPGKIPIPSSVVPSRASAASAPPELSEAECYEQIREPKAQKVVQYTPNIITQIAQQLRRLNFRVEDLTLDPEAYRAYFEAADYPARFPDYYAFNLAEKSLEHFVAAQLLELRPGDVYIDIASERSPVPEIYAEQFGCKCYRQDLAYPEGIQGDRIGGDAAAMPVHDAFASKMALHCSFEHFEGDADMRFIREAQRVLRSGGKVCFVPIYLFNEFVNQASPVAAARSKVEFDADATVYAKLGWRHGFARYYDPAHLASRIRANAEDLDLVIYHVTNAREIDPSCYMRFVLLATKP